MLYRWLPLLLLVALWPFGYWLFSGAGTPAATASSQLRIDDTLKRANNQAVTMARQGNYKGARQVLLRFGTANDTVRYNLAQLELHLNNAAYAAQLLRTTPAFRLAGLNLGVAECMQGDYENGLLDLSTSSSSSQSADRLAYDKGLANLRLNLQDGRNNVGQADQFFREAIRLNPSELRYRMARGDGLMALKRYDEALKAYKQALDETSHPVLYAQMGQAALAGKQYEEAAGYFESYLASRDRSVHLNALLGLGHAYYRQKLFQKALLQYRKAIQVGPTSSQAHTSLGNALTSTHDYRAAASSYDQALRLDSTNRYARLGRGVVSYRLGEFGKSVRHFQKIGDLLDPKAPEHFDFFATQGFSILRSGGRGQDAEPLFQQALKLNNKSPIAYAGLGESHIQAKSFTAALDYTELALKRNYEDDRLLTNRANLLFKFNEFAQAHENYRHAAAVNPHNLNALNGLAMTLLEMDYLDRAQQVYDSVIARTPRAFLYNNRGIVKSYLGLRSEKARDLNKARNYYTLSLKDFNQGQDMDPARKFYNNNSGNVYKNIRDFDNAVRSYEAYLSPNAINNMGVLYANNDNGNFARHYLNTAIQIDSSNLIYLYNRSRTYQSFYKDSLAHRKDIQAAGNLIRYMPPNSIASKYSKDGYVTIYMVDFEYDKFDFPGEYLFPIEAAPAEQNPFLPAPDFLEMPLEKKAAPKPPAYTKVKVKNLRAGTRQTRRWGSTKCPID